MNLIESNYYSTDANISYFSVSQIKAFTKCEAAAMAELKGEYIQEKTKALILGSLVDEMLTGTKKSQEKFINENRAELFKKNGEPYADVAQALEAVERIKKQPLMMEYLSGQHQVIMTGEIEGVPFKIKMDSYQPGKYIADLKYMASLRSPNMYESMIRYWGYDTQAACYQEIVRQNTGKKLPFYFVVATKEKPAHLEVGEMSQWNMDDALEIVKKSIVNFQKVKNGEAAPERCEDYNCSFCTATKIITKPIDTDFFGLSKQQLNTMNGVI